MNVLIIEDEQLAAQRMKDLLRRYDPGIGILDMIDSVKSSVRWFKENPAPDLVFMDIQLADGLSFEIFDAVTVNSPVIFTTAYEEYAIRAFKVNSIDYLLKPIEDEELKRSLAKYHERVNGNFQNAPIEKRILESVREMITGKYKNRFAVKVGEHIRSIPVEDILYFYSLEKGTFLLTSDNHHYLIDYTLDKVADMVNPQTFFRLNRKYLARFASITDIVSYSSSRLKIMLKYSDDNDILVSREKVSLFRQWLDS